MVILGKTKSKSPDKLTLARTLVNTAVPEEFCAPVQSPLTATE
jgi:hypothetical protein